MKHVAIMSVPAHHVSDRRNLQCGRTRCMDSRYTVLTAAAILTLFSGCGMRPMNWLLHNTFPSACKTCPGGLPGPNGCRSFVDPWCAGYQTTMWRPLGTDCGPARMPEPTVAAAPAEGEAGASQEGREADAPPALPSDFPNPLPDPNALPPPDVPPALPPATTTPPSQPDDPFPLKEVPSTPLDSEPTEPSGTPPATVPPTDLPDFFTEPFPGDSKSPSKTTPSEKKPPADTKPPTRPSVPPPSENIDDLFNDLDPVQSTPSALPERKSPEALPEPAPRPIAKEPEGVAPSEATGAGSAPRTKSPLPLDSNNIPSLEEDPTIFRDRQKSPPATTPPGEEAPNLFDGSGTSQLESDSYSTLRIRDVVQTSGEEQPRFYADEAGWHVDVGGDLYGGDQGVRQAYEPEVPARRDY